MKNTGIISSFFISILAAAFYVACSDSSGTSSDNVETVDSVYGLGECDSANEGMTRYVESEGKNYTCSNGEWNVAAAQVDSTKSIHGLGECNKTNEGITKFVKSEETYYKCENGEWSQSSSSSGPDSTIIQMSGTISVDQENKTMVVAISNAEDVCVNENSTYAWKNVDFGVDSSFAKYLFVGDTLVIIDCDEIGKDGEPRYCDEEGQMFVGGSAGSLNGTWKSVSCMYDTDDETSQCFKPCKDVPGGKLTDEEMAKVYEDMFNSMSEQDMDAELVVGQNMMDRMTCLDDNDLSRLAEATLKISGNSITSKVTYSLGYNNFDDYMNSRFMSKFYRNLANGDPSIPDTYYLTEEDSSGVENYIKSAGIEVTRQTKNSVTFKFADQTFSVNVKKFNRTLNSHELAMSVSFNNLSCDLNAEEGEVTKSTCKAEYGDFFDKETEKDAFGNKITVAYEYEKSNQKDFNRCTDTMEDSVYAAIKGKGNSNDNPLCDSYKESYDACVSMMGEGEVCDEYQAYYEFCLEGGEYSTYPYKDWPAEGDPALYKKATSSAELAKKKFLKNARKIARKLLRLK